MCDSVPTMEVKAHQREEKTKERTPSSHLAFESILQGFQGPLDLAPSRSVRQAEWRVRFNTFQPNVWDMYELLIELADT